MKKKVSNKKRNSLLAGALVGKVLGIVAGVLESESGKKAQKKFTKLSGDFYKYIAPQVRRMKQVSRPQYEAFVSEKAKNYAKAKKLSTSETNILAAKAKHSWQHIQKHLQ